MHAASTFVAIVLLAMPASVPFGHGIVDDLDKARQQYRDAVRKAQQDHDAAIEAAAAKLRTRLQAAIEQATKARQMDTVKTLLAELESLAPGALPVFGTKGDVVQGTWSVAYHAGGAKRTYVVKAGGEVACAELGLSGSIRQENGKLMLDLHDGKLERLTFAGGRMFVEHYDPKDSFPKLAQIGIGELEPAAARDRLPRRAPRGQGVLVRQHGGRPPVHLRRPHARPRRVEHSRVRTPGPASGRCSTPTPTASPRPGGSQTFVHCATSGAAASTWIRQSAPVVRVRALGILWKAGETRRAGSSLMRSVLSMSARRTMRRQSGAT